VRPRRSTVFAALATLFAVPALNGCSNSAQSNGTIAGAVTANPTAPSAAPTVSGLASIPSDLTLDVEMPSTGDAAKDALLTKTRALLYAFEQAVAQGNPNAPLYQSMLSGGGSTAVYAQVAQFTQDGQRPVGSLKFYGFTVVVRAPAADVLFCEDTSQTELLDTKSGSTTAASATGGAQNYWDIGYLTLNGKSTIESVVIRAGGSACTD
jgi:hypothetical protein